MIVKWQGEEFTLDLEAMTYNQALQVEQRLDGLSFMDILTGLDALKPKALMACYWLMHEQSGRRIAIEHTDFPMLKFAAAMKNAMNAPVDPDPKDESPSEASTGMSGESLEDVSPSSDASTSSTSLPSVA